MTATVETERQAYRQRQRKKERQKQTNRQTDGNSYLFECHPLQLPGYHSIGNVLEIATGGKIILQLKLPFKKKKEKKEEKKEEDRKSIN